MKLSNAINKLGKYGKVQKDETGLYWIAYKGYIVSFRANGDYDDPNPSIVCEHTQRYEEKADSQTDYFPGSYWDSLTQAIKIVDKRFESSLMRLQQEEVKA